MLIQRLLPAFATLLLFFGLTGLALSQGQVPTVQLPTPTPQVLPPNYGQPADQIATQALPDLIVTGIRTIPSPPQTGRATRIFVTIQNRGDAVSCSPPNNFNTDLYIDPPIDPFVNYHQIVSPTLGLPWGAQCFWMAAGASYELETTWVFTDVGTFNVWAQVDSDGNVTESNEDNNSRKVPFEVTTTGQMVQATHQDFLTHLASTLENDDPTGKLRLSRFQEPPLFNRPFADGSCTISDSSMTIDDYNLETPDLRINQVITNSQIAPQLFASGDGVVVSVWEDLRNGPTLNRDIYLRYSTDRGETWQPELKVNDDNLIKNQTNPAVALSRDGTMMVAWQDNRSGNWDIYYQQLKLSGSTLSKVGGNMLVGGSGSYNALDQIFPDVAVDESGGFHFAWEDKRNGNSDIFATSYITRSGTLTWTNVRRIDDGTGNTQQTRPQFDALDWQKITGIDYTVAPVSPYTVTINKVFSETSSLLVATWEDNRLADAAHPEIRDIAMTISVDGGETYDDDLLLTSSPTDGIQQKPDVILTQDIATLNVTIPITGDTQHTEEIDAPLGEIHLVWEGDSSLDNPDSDIYYATGTVGVTQRGDSTQFDPAFAMGSPEKINKDDIRDWQTGPVDQSDPALTSVPCPGQTINSSASNIFITWSDGRNYDDLNYDIYYDVKSPCEVSFGSNQLLADGVTLRNFDTTDPGFANYNPGHPPPARQSNPSVAADIQIEGTTIYTGYLYLAWEDDRAGNPQQNKDIYLARSNLTYYNQVPYGTRDGAGSHISSIIDSKDPDTTWYSVAWNVTTPDSTYITVQTRLGNTITDVLASEWYPQNFPFQPQPGACTINGDAFDSGAPLPGHDAPGQHIEDSSGNFWPQARYIQYRVNMYTRDETKTPVLDSLTLYYDNEQSIAQAGNHAYLPIIMK